METVGRALGIAFGYRLCATVNGSERYHVGIIVAKPYDTTYVVGKPCTHLRYIYVGRLLRADGALVEILLSIHIIGEWSGAIRHFPRSHTQIGIQCQRCAFIMVAHHVLHVLHTQGLLRLHVQRHGRSLSVTLCICQVRCHILCSPFIEETPYACFAEPKSTEVGRCISISKGEVLILTLEISFLASKGYNVLAVQAVVLILEWELTNATVIGMSRDAVIGDAHSHPYDTLASRTFAYDIHNPYFLGVGDGEGLAFASISIGIGQVGEDLDGLTCITCSLQSHIHQAAIVHQSCDCVGQFLASAEGGLMNSELVFVHQSHHGICLGCLGNFSQIIV